MEQSRSGITHFFTQSGWFVIVGSFAAVTHFLGLVFWVHFVHIKPVWANVLAFLLAFLVSFAGHFQATFRHSVRSWQQALWRWLCSSIIGFGLNQLLFTMGLKLFGSQAYIPVWFMATVLVTILTFALGKFWAFRYAEINDEKSHDQC